jgi:hypothetical protein
MFIMLVLILRIWTNFNFLADQVYWLGIGISVNIQSRRTVLMPWLEDNVVHSPVTIYKSEHDFIQNIVSGTGFPWFWQGQQTFDDAEENVLLPKDMRYFNGPYLSHVLLRRTEEEDVSHLTRSPKDFSEHYEFFIEIFHRWIVEHDLKYTKIFRANLNLNWYNGDLHTEPHLDHSWDHNNFIMYLDTCDNAETLLWSDNFSEMYAIPCVRYTAVSFKSSWHAHKYPPLGQRRLVFVVTYI